MSGKCDYCKRKSRYYRQVNQLKMFCGAVEYLCLVHARQYKDCYHIGDFARENGFVSFPEKSMCQHPGCKYEATRYKLCFRGENDVEFYCGYHAERAEAYDKLSDVNKELKEAGK